MTKNAQHTPGPWGVQNGTYSGWEKSSICTVYATKRVPTEDGMGAQHVTIVGPAHADDYHAEQSANARLIAAAPELLDALRNARVALAGPKSPLLVRIDDVLKKATAA